VPIPFMDNAPLRDKFGRFVAWYARAFVLVPSDFRASLPDPRDFDDYEAEIARNEIARVLDAFNLPDGITSIASTTISDAAKDLARELKEGAQKAASGIGQMLAGVGVAWLVISVLTGRSRAR
jgi:X-X-X-Leu-X-X-Gly heptad repeat protein